MTIANFSLFCLVYFAAVASPGPAIVALVARVLSQGLKGMPFFMAGFVMGDLVWFTFAATGLSLIAQTFHGVFLAIRYAGALYLLYLAYRLWTAPTESQEISTAIHDERPFQRFLSSFALTLGNPKVMVFFLALLPTVVDLDRLNLASFLQIATAIAIILSGVFMAYALAANRARKLFTNRRAMRLLNRSSGTAMAGTAIAVATQQS